MLISEILNDNAVSYQALHPYLNSINTLKSYTATRQVNYKSR